MKRLILVALLSAAQATIAAADPLKITRLKGAINNEINTSVITEIYARAGVPVKFLNVPSKRAAHLVKEGAADGEVSRVFNYGKKRDYLHRLEPAINSLNTVAFVRKGSGILVESKEDLGSYRVGVVRGILHSNKASQGSRELVQVASVKQLIQMLELGRIDVAVHSENAVALELFNTEANRIDPDGIILGSQSVHHYIRKEYAEEIETLEETIRVMEEAGELRPLAQRAREQFIARLPTSSR